MVALSVADRQALRGIGDVEVFLAGLINHIRLTGYYRLLKLSRLLDHSKLLRRLDLVALSRNHTSIRSPRDVKM